MDSYLPTDMALPPPHDLPVTWTPYCDQPWIWFRREKPRPVAVQLVQRPPRLTMYTLYGLLLGMAGIILVLMVGRNG